MAKTDVTLAFGQMPKDMQEPFKALYPEIVHETPVSITVDPENRSLEFTVGSREMTFGPSNENYSVFLLGCYRLLFGAAQKQGWMSQYPTDQTAQAEAPAGQVAPNTLEVAPTPATAPAAPAPAAEPPKMASKTAYFNEPNMDAFPADLEGHGEPGPEDFFNATLDDDDLSLKEISDRRAIDQKTEDIYGIYQDELGVPHSGPQHMSPEEKARVKAELATQQRFAALQAKVAYLPNTPEVEAFRNKLAALRVKKASTDITPDREDKLYVRPLDFVNGLREDWLSWMDQHGGEDTLKLQGTIDILDTHKHSASTEAAALADTSGWSHTSSFWTNPKGLQCADDSKLVSQLRMGSVKEALAADMPPPTPNQANPPAQVNHQNSPSWVTNPNTPTAIGAVGEEDSNVMGDISMQRTAAANAAKAKLSEAVLNQLKQSGASFDKYSPELVKEWVIKHANEVTEYHQDPGSKKVFAHATLDMAKFSGLAKLLKASKTGSVDGEAQLKGHTDNPVEDLADGSTGEVTANDEAQKVQMKEVATAKSASSLDFRPEKSSSVKTASVKTAYSPEVSQAVNQFISANMGAELTLPELKSAVSNISSAWKEMLHYMQDFKLLQASGVDRVKVMNRDMIDDQSHGTSHVPATVTASIKEASGYHDRMWVKPDCSMVPVEGDEEENTHYDTAKRLGLGGGDDAKCQGWVRIGIVHSKAYVDYTTMTDAQLHAIQVYFMGLTPSRVTVEGRLNGSYCYAEFDPADEFYTLNHVSDLRRYKAVYASTHKIARSCDATPINTTVATFPVRIDCPVGATVTGTSPDGTPWNNIQSVNYGEITGTQGGDGEAVDVFLGQDENSPWVFIINQTRTENDEVVPDEIKVGLGFWSLEDAKDAYLSMFPQGWSDYDPNIITASVDSLREWLASHNGVKNVTADDFNLTTTTPELVQPEFTVAPEVFNSMSNAPSLSYTASVDHDIKAQHQADVLTMFHDPASRPMDKTAAHMATLFATQTVDFTRGHQASAESLSVSAETSRGNLTPTKTSSVRIAEIITADLCTGMSPEECDHRASQVNYFGTDQKTFRTTLAKLAGVAGTLALQPNFIKKSCVATHAALNGQFKNLRSKTAFHSVASTSECAGCTNCKCNSKGEKHCALFGKPIVASVEEMHHLADTVWGASSEAHTPLGLNKRAAAHHASRKEAAAVSPIQRVTAAVDFGDGAESRPTPKMANAPREISPRAFVVSALSQGQSPARIAEIIDRSTVHSASFKEAAKAELDTQKGLMGFLTVVPHFAGSCSITHGKHFASTARPVDKRKLAFHSVTKIAACQGCNNCVKNASGGERCSLYGKPLVATLSDLKRVASTVFPALASKIATASKEDLAKEALPYLAQALGVPENHPSLKAFQVPAEIPKQVETEIDPEKVDDKSAKDARSNPTIEGASKNVMDIAMTASKPKTVDLEGITTKVKESLSAGKTASQIYTEVKAKFAKVDRPELQRIVRRIVAENETSVSQSQCNDGIATDISTTDPVFGNMLKQLAEDAINRTKPQLTDNVVDLGEMEDMETSSDEFDGIQDFCQ